MGQYASKIKGHYVTRNLQRFNIESRTEKLLKSEKLNVAPKYPADEKLRQDILRDMPEEIEKELHSKSSELHNRLKDVYVTSQDPAKETGFDPDINRRRPENPDRPLPKSRTSKGMDRSAFARDMSKHKKGKLSLEKLQEMIATHKADLEKNTPKLLAQHYKLDLAVTESILEHFRVYGHVKIKPISAKERKDMEDPYRAQPDWVEAAGEHPPVITKDEMPLPGKLPKMNKPVRPLVLQKEENIAIAPGKKSPQQELSSGSDQIQLEDSTREDKKK